MKIAISYPDELDALILAVAKEDGHNSRNAVLRKALAFFLEHRSQKVACEVPKKEEGVEK